MRKVVLITGASGGIGFETARMMAAAGHHVLLQGRSPERLDAAVRMLSITCSKARVDRYAADLSSMGEVIDLARTVADEHAALDVIVNGAGVHYALDEITEDGLDIRFAINAIAPWLLTRGLLSRLGSSGRVINVSTSRQRSVDLEALTGNVRLADGMAYAQSHLALTMWSRALGRSLGDAGPSIIVVDPGSTAVRTVIEGDAARESDLRAGARVIVRAALESEYAGASSGVFDAGSNTFLAPHPDVADLRKSSAVLCAMESVICSTRSRRKPFQDLRELPCLTERNHETGADDTLSQTA